MPLDYVSMPIFNITDAADLEREEPDKAEWMLPRGVFSNSNAEVRLNTPNLGAKKGGDSRFAIDRSAASLQDPDWQHLIIPIRQFPKFVALSR